MYISRRADLFLSEWYSSASKKPLIVRGARQIGKTETIRRFAASHYKSVIEINFYEEPQYKKITSDGYSVETICHNITLIDPRKRFISGETLLFFDELQDYPEIATALKFFAIDGRYDVICSGSLLGLHYKRIESNSVGYKQDYTMRSIDFEEFLGAKGYGEDIIHDMLHHMLDLKPFSDVESDVFEKMFFDYCMLGGMPAIVREYLETGTFSGTLELQRQLIADYEEDIRKYTEGLDQAKVIRIYRQIPSQLAKENKKFQISKVTSGARLKDYEGCIEWLCDAGVINLCYCLHMPELPLKGNNEENKFKIYTADTGMLIAMLDDEAQEDLRANRNMNVYKGGLYENIVAEALVKSGYDLHYYKKENSTLEEDFFVRTKKCLVPVEVKSTNGRSKSLRTLIDSEKYPEIRWGIKLVKGNIGFMSNIYTFPYYCGFLLKRYLMQKDTEK